MSTWGCKRSSNDGQLGQAVEAAKLVVPGGRLKSPNERCCWPTSLMHLLPVLSVWSPASLLGLLYLSQIFVRSFRLLPGLLFFHHNISQLIFLALCLATCWVSLGDFLPIGGWVAGSFHETTALDSSGEPVWSLESNNYATHVRSRNWYLEVN